MEADDYRTVRIDTLESGVQLERVEYGFDKRLSIDGTQRSGSTIEESFGHRFLSKGVHISRSRALSTILNIKCGNVTGKVTDQMTEIKTSTPLMERAKYNLAVIISDPQPASL